MKYLTLAFSLFSVDHHLSQKENTLNIMFLINQFEANHLFYNTFRRRWSL